MLGLGHRSWCEYTIDVRVSHLVARARIPEHRVTLALAPDGRRPFVCPAIRWSL